jgi:archaemetzincin
MKKILIIVIVALFGGLVSFGQNPYSIEGKMIYIQPMGKVDHRLVWVVDSAIRKFYNCRSITLTPVEPTKDLLTPSKTKYDCNKILTKFCGGRRVLVITEKDISHFANRDYPEWSIWGLAYVPGSTAVISTHILKEDGSDIKVVSARLIKDALHELGHNIGLQHCNRDKRCLMNDGSEGVSELDDECIWLCNYCRARIK